MSKEQLQKAAQESSGVSYEESLLATKLVPSLYERIGKEAGFERLSQDFYDKVFADKQAAWFLNIFSSSTKQDAVENQTFGGPDLYSQKKGKYTRLVGRHANYNVGFKAAERWVHHMKEAIDNHDSLDEEARECMVKYFSYMAHYIVVASDYMRPDQLSGGTKMDSGRVWRNLDVFSIEFQGQDVAVDQFNLSPRTLIATRGNLRNTTWKETL